MTTTKAIRLASLVTAINVLVASGFSIAAIIRPQYLVPAESVPTEASLLLAMYAAARSIRLALFVLGAIYKHATPALLILGVLAGGVQLLDAGIGLFEHDPGKCAGPLSIAVLQFFVVYLLHSSVQITQTERGYLTAHMALSLAGFQAGKTVLAPAIGGSVGNAVTQLARALGARHAVSATTSHTKAEQARTLGFDEVIDLSIEKLGEGVRRITEDYGSDIVIDAIGGDVLSEALGTLAIGGSLTALGYSASRKATIDVTDLIWKRAIIKSFSLFAQPSEMWRAAWKAIGALLESGPVKPIVARTFPLEDATEALRYQIESRPFGRVVLEI